MSEREKIQVRENFVRSADLNKVTAFLGGGGCHFFPFQSGSPPKWPKYQFFEILRHFLTENEKNGGHT